MSLPTTIIKFRPPPETPLPVEGGNGSGGGGSLPKPPTDNATAYFLRGDETWALVDYNHIAGLPLSFPPSHHAKTHATGGSDPISGLLPPLLNDPDLVLLSTGAFGALDYSALTGVPPPAAPLHHGPTHVLEDLVPVATDNHPGLLPTLPVGGSAALYLGADLGWYPFPATTLPTPPNDPFQVLLGTGKYGFLAYSALAGIPALFPPALHAASHQLGGLDPLALDTLAAPTDTTTLNATATAHGLLPKLPNVVTQFLNGTGHWSVPAGGGGGGGGSGDMSTSVYDVNLDGIVDHAAVADTAPWNGILNAPLTFPPTIHGGSHVGTGADPIPVVNTSAAGLTPRLSGTASTYLNGTGNYTTPAGATGPQGPPGANAYTLSASGFTVPPVGQTAQVTVQDASWVVVGQVVYVDQAGGGGQAGALTVTAKAGNTLTLYNPLTSTGAGDMLMSVYDPDADGIVEVAETVAWTGITGKPGLVIQYGADNDVAVVESSGSSAPILTGMVTPVSGSGSDYLQIQPRRLADNSGGDGAGIALLGPTFNTPNRVQVYAGNNASGYQLFQFMPTGSLALPKDPVNSGDAVTKSYVDARMPTGSMVDFAGSVAPTGWLLCDGSPYATTGTYAALFNVIGYAFGGSGGTFNVPDLRGRVAVGAGDGPTTSNRVLGATGGEENHPLTIGELAAHNHVGVNHLHPFTGVDHLHYVPGVDHLHGDDHYLNIGAGQFNHAHSCCQPINYASYANYNVGGVQTLYTLNNGSYQYWNGATYGATLPAGNTVYKSQTGFPSTTYAMDRSPACWSYGADRSLASTTGACDRDLTTTTTGSGTGHNTMQPFAVVNKIIKT